MDRTEGADEEKPLAIDLYCGLGGWTEGLLAEGYYVVGFDNVAQEVGGAHYPGQLVIQDVLTLHGSQFRDAALIVGSSPCQEFSYRAMPWMRAKAMPPPELGIRLFEAQFRIQREASEAAGHHIPMVVENVRGAIPWVGRSRWNFGSYHLWGDVPALMPMTKKVMKNSGGKVSPHWRLDGEDSVKVPGHWNQRNGHRSTPHLTAPAEHVKYGPDGFTAAQNGSNPKNNKRKAASALIAKIPLALAQHIARVYKPCKA